MALMTTIEAPQKRRIPALDYTKGTLVLIMVLYHWLNYFVSPEGQIYRYLRFLTPSFIFISGFLISHVYFATYGIGDSRVPKRLMWRGLKILAVFILLNAVRTFLIPDSRSGLMPSRFWSTQDLMAVYITGNVAVGGSKVAIFPILVPIGYLLLLSAGLVTIYRRYKYTFHVISLLLLLCNFILGFIGVGYGNLELLTIGLLGVTFGHIPLEAVSRIVTHRYALTAAYLGYIAAITAWKVVYPVQLAGVFLNLVLIYVLGVRNGGHGSGRHIVLLGKYSLFGYIAQIAVLQALYRGLRPMSPGAARVAISCIAAFSLTIICVEVLDRARSRVVAVDRLYKAVFA